MDPSQLNLIAATGHGSGMAVVHMLLVGVLVVGGVIYWSVSRSRRDAPDEPTSEHPVDESDRQPGAET